MATIYEVSERAEVSLATVSRVMNNSARVSEKTRQKVLDAMRELGYTPNSIAQSLASNRSNTIGIVVPELHGPFFSTMLSGIEQELRAEGKYVVITIGHSDAEKEVASIEFLRSRKCDALILHVDAVGDDYLEELAQGDVPVVLLNRQISSLADRCIDLDNEMGGYVACRAMLDLGHTEIAYIRGPAWKSDANARLQGHQRALREAGMRLDTDLVFEGDYHETSGAEGLKTLLDTGTPFTALLCANDEMAAGAMDEARRRGIAVPKQLSIVGFDNVNFARYLHPKLSTVDYPLSDIGAMAARWVLHCVYDKEGVELIHSFTPRFIARDSSAPPPEKS